MNDHVRQHIQAQIAELQQKAIAKPMPEDQMGMIGFMSALLAAKMQSLLSAAEQEPVKQLEVTNEHQ